MKTRQQWLSEYAATHQNPLNKTIHLICVPAIMFSSFGLLWHLRWGDSVWTSFAWPAALLVLSFYARIGRGPLGYMAATVAMIFTGIATVEAVGLPGLFLYGAVFMVAWIAQFYGHLVEGKKPSFFKDLQFFLIGPLWVYYRRG